MTGNRSNRRQVVTTSAYHPAAGPSEWKSTAATSIKLSLRAPQSASAHWIATACPPLDRQIRTLLAMTRRLVADSAANRPYCPVPAPLA
jgi:hypothetical protein